MTRARDNPFRVERLHHLSFRGSGFNRRELIERFDRLGRRAAIVGDHGTGKTTLLAELMEDLRSRSEEVISLRLSSDHRRTAALRVRSWLQEAIGSDAILVLDGAEQLPWRTWRALERKSLEFRGLLITTHRPGRLSTLLQTGSTPELLQELVEELTGVPLTDRAPAIRDLFRRHRGNLRDCLRTLYDGYPDWPASA